VLHGGELASVEALRGFAGRGTLPARVRSAFDRASASIEARREAARARLSLGLQFFDRREVDRAVALLATSPAVERTDGTRLLLALALALHAGPRDLSEWTGEPLRPERLDLGALDVMAGSTVSATRAMAEYDAGVVRELEAGPLAGELAPLETQLHRYQFVLAQPWSPASGYIKERVEALLFLLEQIEKDDAVPGYVASTPIRFEGWPRVRVVGGTWFTPHKGMIRIGTVNRTGSVNRELRRLSYRFERCFTAANASHSKVPGDVGLRFLIARDGSVFGAAAESDAPEGAALAGCIAGVSTGLSFRQPEMGVWAVDVRFRAK